jgi:hypothetical protein
MQVEEEIPLVGEGGFVVIFVSVNESLICNKAFVSLSKE